MRKKILIGLISIITVVAVAVAVISHQNQPKPEKYVQEQVPTFFFHGWGGSYESEQQMTNAARSAGATSTIIRADVSSKGEVSLSQPIPKNATNLIIEVSFEDNKNTDYKLIALWAKNVISTVKEQYNFKEFNVVGHSMGNMAIMYYLLLHRNEIDAKVVKQVNLAGHFDGILGEGDEAHRIKLESSGLPNYRDEHYNELLALRKDNVFKSIDVLNIFGDLEDGTDSDEAVSNNSSRSLKYLVGPTVKSYKEIEIFGKGGQHSELHENKQVNQALINFLWKKQSE